MNWVRPPTPLEWHKIPNKPDYQNYNYNTHTHTHIHIHFVVIYKKRSKTNIYKSISTLHTTHTHTHLNKCDLNIYGFFFIN